MPNLPELPIRVDPDVQQVDGDERYKQTWWQTHRGPKPAPDPNGKVPEGFIYTEQTP